MELLQALEVVVGVYKNLPEGEVEDHPFLYQNTNIKSETKARVCKTLNAAVLSLTHLPKIFLLTLLFVKFFLGTLSTSNQNGNHEIKDRGIT